MLYVVKYRYVDRDGEEKSLFDGFDSSKKEVLGVDSASDRRVCAYASKRSAFAVKRDVDSMLENMRRRKMAKKTWKAKVEAAPKSLTLGGATRKAADNAAFRYYYSLGV